MVVELAHTYINTQQQEKSYMCMQMNTSPYTPLSLQ